MFALVMGSLNERIQELKAAQASKGAMERRRREEDNVRAGIVAADPIWRDTKSA